MTIDEIMMMEAIKQAELARERDEVPVGAVIVFENRIISRAYNQVEMLKDPTAHAEMIAVTQATNYLQSKWLQECVMYVTLEPCLMCAGALVLARLGKLVFGAHDPKTGACGSVENIVSHKKLNHQIETSAGILGQQCATLLSNFFQQKRKTKLNDSFFSPN